MKIHHRLLAAFSLLALLAGVVGFYSLHATRKIVDSFEGGEEHFRTIIKSASEASSYAQRAKSHLVLYLTLHHDSDLNKFYERSASLREQLSLLDKAVQVENGRRILAVIQSNADDLFAAGEQLIAAYREETADRGTFAPVGHAELIRRLHRCCFHIKEATADLQNLETDFLNKQLAITASSSVSDLAKMTESSLMLYFTLKDPQDLERYYRRGADLKEALATLHRQVRAPEANRLLSEIDWRYQRFQKGGADLLEIFDQHRQTGQFYAPAEHASQILTIHSQGARIRELGLELAAMMADLEAEKKAEVLKMAASVQRSVLLLAVVGGLLILVLGYFLSVAIAKPIIKLKEAAQQIGHGDTGAVSEIGGRGEIATLAECFQSIASELQATRDELLSSKEYTDNILRSMSDALFVVSPDGNLQTVNTATCKLLDYEEHEIIGKPLENFLGDSPPFQFDRMESHDLPAMHGVDMTMKGKTNKAIPVSFSCSILYNKDNEMEGVVCVAQDITEQRQALEELARLATVVEQAAEAIVITDPGGRIQYVNPAFEHITGYKKEEAVGDFPRLLKSGRHKREFYKDLWLTLIRGEIWSGHFINRKKDGSLYEEECIISPVRDQTGRVINYVALKRDVTNEKRLERQLMQSQKHEALGTLAGGIAHDLNNILTPVVGYASLAMNSVSKKTKTYRHLEKIIKAGERASNLVNQILTFSRKQEQEREPLHLAAVVREALTLLRGTLPSTIEMRHNLEECPTMVLADANQVHQVIMNLCTNAYQAMRTTGGVLTVELTEAVLDPAGISSEFQPGAGKYVRLAVQDTGCGMDKETQSRIFEPYFTTKQQGEGSGLGLATVHGIVKNHDGVINVRSIPGEGTLFEIYLPALERVSSRPPASTEADCRQAETNGAKCILLVDDEQMVVDLGTEILHRSGYRVVSRTDSQAALALFRENPQRFDLVITDQTMPGLTGVDLARQLLNIRRDIPILLATGYSEMVDEQHAKALGIKEFLMKPFKPCDLVGKAKDSLTGNGTSSSVV